MSEKNDNLEAYQLYRSAKRSYSKATTHRQRIKEATKSEDKVQERKYYERYRKQSYRKRMKLAKHLNEPKKDFSIKNFNRIEQNIRVQKGKAERKQLRTKFVRIVKYKKDGKTVKRRITYKFKGKEDIRTFLQYVKEGKIPVPKREDPDIVFLFDPDYDDWALHELIWMFKEES